MQGDEREHAGHSACRWQLPWLQQRTPFSTILHQPTDAPGSEMYQPTILIITLTPTLWSAPHLVSARQRGCLRRLPRTSCQRPLRPLITQRRGSGAAVCAAPSCTAAAASTAAASAAARAMWRPACAPRQPPCSCLWLQLQALALAAATHAGCPSAAEQAPLPLLPLLLMCCWRALGAAAGGRLCCRVRWLLCTSCALLPPGRTAMAAGRR